MNETKVTAGRMFADCGVLHEMGESDCPDDEPYQYVPAEVADALLAALTDLVKANESWNADVAAVVGRPVGWSDSYLDAARRAIRESNKGY